LLIGGSEKLGQVDFELDVPIEHVDEPERALAEAIAKSGATEVVDLSDEPVMTNRLRGRLASIALWKRASYRGPDFEFTPPRRDLRPNAPTIAVIGTGKRTGKTAIGATAARIYREAGLKPVVAAMGRGGPSDPEVIEESESLDPQRLMDLTREGRHAASDYIEDALIAGVPTVGAWRAGGGLAGAPFFTNAEAAIRRAEALDPGVLVLEGSGAAIPPAQWNAGILVVNAGADPEALCGYFGLYRLLLTDLVVLTMVEESVDIHRLDEITQCILSRPFKQPKVVRTIFRPYPLGEIEGKKVWFATTAPHEANAILTNHLNETFGAEVIGISHALGNREALRRDVESARDADAVLVELKAAAVDVVTEYGLRQGKEVIYVDNRPQSLLGEIPISEALVEMAELAKDRYRDE
jgi:cyclic 2,3-diphosphoglycerate synthetase